MALDADTLGNLLADAVSGVVFGSVSLPTLGAIMKSYLMTGSPASGQVATSLSPCDGSGWLALIGAANPSGVASAVIPTTITTELAGSTITTPAGVTIPAPFNAGATVDADAMRNADNYIDVWIEIAKGIIDYVSPTLT